MTNASLLDVRHLTKRYASGARSLTVLRDVTFSIAPGQVCAVMGPSGSGKTTLLGLCAGLDRPDEGTVRLDEVRINELSEEERARLRRAAIGFVFQGFRLLPTLTALENVMVPLELNGERGARARAEDLLDRVGLKERLRHYPAQLSGGEQQRVGLARAFIHKPKILFADEPTGNLDTETGEHVARLLFDLNRDEGTTLVIVTHNPDLAARADRVLRLSAGALAGDEPGAHAGR